MDDDFEDVARELARRLEAITCPVHGHGVTVLEGVEGALRHTEPCCDTLKILIDEADERGEFTVSIE